MMGQQSGETAATIAAKAAPPAAIIGMQLMGVPVDDWIKWLTLAYILLMLLHKGWHMGREAYDFWVLKKRDGVAPKSDE